jgi:hypothetical protein
LYKKVAAFCTSKRLNLVPEAADVFTINWPNFVPEGGRFLYKQAAEFSAIKRLNFVPEGGRF